MADLSLTAANVVMVSGTAETATAGETLVQGQPVYRKASDSKMYKGDNNASAATAEVLGIALNCASAGQPVRFQKTGLITIGATTAAGTIYCLSPTAGGIMPAADLASGNFVTILGVGFNTTQIQLGINRTGIAV